MDFEKKWPLNKFYHLYLIFSFFCYKINNITYGAFENMVQLQHLDLSGNDLKYIPSGAFIGMFYREFFKAISGLPDNHDTVIILRF